MTLLQLKYVLMVADEKAISKAAKKLFISQPSLTQAIKELEKELSISIFSRTNKGVSLTREGEEFIGYARQVIEQTQLIEEKYFGAIPVRHQFCVSTQHYSFAVEAFVDLLKHLGGSIYDFRIRETKTHEIIEDVSRLKSEVGVLYCNEFNRVILEKAFKENQLTFHPLIKVRPHIFVSSTSPLAGKTQIQLEDLEPYPRLSYEQGSQNSFYYSEEILSTRESQKDIMVSDRATLFNLLIGLDGYTICSGIINEELNGPNIVAIPLDVDEYMEIGYLTHNQVVLSRFAHFYIESLKTYTQGRS